MEAAFLKVEMVTLVCGCNVPCTVSDDDVNINDISTAIFIDRAYNKLITSVLIKINDSNCLKWTK